MKKEDEFNPFLVCGPKPKKFTKAQKKRLEEKLAEKKHTKENLHHAQRIDMEYVLRGKKSKQ